jgi:tetratricopeptide (TPR) repeat protein
LLYIWGLYHLQTGNADLALTKSENLLDLAQEVEAQKYICLAQQLRGDALVELRRFDEATIALKRTVQLAESISYRPAVWEAGQRLAIVQPNNNQKVLAKARSLVRETAEQISDSGLRQTFLESPKIQALIDTSNNPT